VRYPRRLPAVVAVLSVALVSPAPSRGGAQAPPAPPSPPATAAPKPEVLAGSSVEVVRLEVVVAEKRGRPRTDLRREDFVVLEDGKPQPIVQFQAFARPPATDAAAGGPKGAAAPTAAPADAGDVDDQLPARYIVLAIDDVHMQFESLSRARKALGKFLKEDLRPEDQVALVTTSGASALSQEFTSDRAVLQQILSRLSAQGRHVDWTTIPHLTEYQAEMIEAGDPLALDAAVQEVMASGLYLDYDTAQAEATRRARAVLAEAIENSRLTLTALESLCRGLAGVSGRKAVVLVSDGFLTGLSTRSDLAYDLRRIADAGTRAGVVVYALDTRGLISGLPGAAPSSPRRIQPTTLGTIQAINQRSIEATRDAMNALAADTGGFLTSDSNDLQAGLRETLRDTETYYVLAYEPTNLSRDGVFRKIEVKVVGTTGLKARTRAGYFGPNGRERGGAEATALARRDEQRRVEMRTALAALAPLSAIPVRLSADFVSLEGATGQVVVSGRVDVERLPFVRRTERRQATLETAALVYDEQGRVVANLETQRTEIDVADADYPALRRQGVSYQKVVPLPSGRYQVRLAAREDATGLLGSAWRRVEVPDLPGRGLLLSSLFLLKDDGAPPAASAGDPVLHSVQDQPRFSRADSLYMQLYAYNAKRDAGGAPDLVAQAQVMRGGVALATAAPEAMEGGTSGPVLHASRIRLQRLEPGDYELRVTVTDRAANAIASRAAPFTVE
jgi:VWFA-related protein